MEFPPYYCVGNENSGSANIYEDGKKIRSIATSRCFVEWYMIYLNSLGASKYTWDWIDGIDPDVPPVEPPIDPPIEPQPVEPE